MYLALIILVVLAGFAAYGYRKYLETCYITSEANEWMLVIRNGKEVACGCGINVWIQPGDQIVKMPATLNKVSFSAENITLEM